MIEAATVRHPPVDAAFSHPMRSAAICRELAARHVDQPAAAGLRASRALTVDPGNAEIVEIIDTLTGQLAE